MTQKQLRFIDEYCKDWNASRAARDSGYSEKTAGLIGHENLRKPQIQAAIKEKVAELCMGPEEALTRLARMARADIGDFITVNDQGHATVDLTDVPTYLIKKVRTRRIKRDDGGWESEVTEIELHDAAAALDKINRVHGAYIDKLDVTSGGEVVTSITLVMDGKATELRNKANEASSGDAPG